VSAKHDHYEDNVKLEDEMKNIKIDELRNITANNQYFNESVVNLIKNWDEMKRFAKQQ